MAIDPALTLLETIEERLLAIIGGRQSWHAITDEQAPPAVANGFAQMLRDRRVIKASRCFARQASQEDVDLAFDLSGLTALSIFILDAQQVC